MTMTLLGGVIARSWGECMWTARDLLKQRAPAPRPGVTINMHPGPPDPYGPPRLVVLYRDSDGMLRRW